MSTRNPNDGTILQADSSPSLLYSQFEQAGFHHQLLNAIEQAIITTDLDGRISSWNSGAEKIYGWRSEEVLGRNILEVTPSNLSQAQAANIMDRLKEGDRWSGEFMVKRRDGSSFPAFVTDTPIINNHGEVIGIIGVSFDITEQFRLEEEQRLLLDESRESREEAESAYTHLTGILNSVTDAFSVLDREGRYTYVNEAATRLLYRMGKTQDEVLGQVIWDVFPDMRGTVAEEVFQRVYADKVPAQFEMHCPLLELWLENRLFPLADGLTFYTQDITERKKNSEEMRSIQRQARCILWSSHVQRVPDEEGKLWLKWSSLSLDEEAAQAVLPLNSEGIGYSWAWYHSRQPEDNERMNRRSEEALLSGEAFYQQEYRCINRHGTVQWLQEQVALESLSADSWHAVGVATDISALKEADARQTFLIEAGILLANSLDYETTLQQLARFTVPSLADFCLVDVVAEGQIQRLVTVHSDSEKEGLLLQLQKQHPPGWDSPTPAAKALRDGTTVWIPIVDPEIIRQQTRDEAHYEIVRTLDVRSHLTVPLFARGETVGAITLARVGTRPGFTEVEVRLAEELARRAALAIDNAHLYKKAQEAEKEVKIRADELAAADQRKDEFLAMLAHELRNPLSPVLTAVQILRIKSPEEPDLKRSMDVIERQVHHMSRMVDDLLEVTRLTRGKITLQKERLDLKDAVEHAVQALRPRIEERGLELVVRVDMEPVLLDADPTRLDQVITNLLNNAIKFTEGGGRISLEAGREREEAVIRVKDNGIGIESEILPQIFDLFTQADRSLDRSQGGLGIGLTMVNSLVRMHGGSVSAWSEGVGQGSEFMVRLPALPQDRTVNVMKNEKTSPKNVERSCRILVVDDRHDAADSLAEVLTLLGHEVCIAYDGPSALSLAAEFHPQIALLDIGLPGMNGYEVVEQIRRNETLNEVMLVAMTGYGQTEDQQRSMEAGFDHHLVKPVDLEKLQEVLRGFDDR